MILQALTEHYKELSKNGDVAPFGWSEAKISFALCIDANGVLERVIDIRDVPVQAKKATPVAQRFELPVAAKRSSGVAANFLWDNSAYMLGIDEKGKPERSRKCFESARELHLQLLKNTETAAAKAVCGFFETWKPEEAREHPLLQECLEDILAGANLTFWLDGAYVFLDEAVRQTWNDHFCKADGPEMVCLVTGEPGPVERLHPSVKGIYNGQPMGNTLVGFNAPAYCSYGKEQSLNAPTSKYAAFAYTSALNHLLADRERVFHVGDTTVACWAKTAENQYADLFGFAFCGKELPKYEERDLRDAVKKLCMGKPVILDEEQFDPDMEFFVLGLSPNAARVSIRFFLRNSFGSFLKNAQAHQKRLEIAKPLRDPRGELSVWWLLRETVNLNSRDKEASPGLAGEVLRAVLTNTPYPATLLNSVMLRIRAEHEITRGRAAIIKAYYSKHTHHDVPEEVLTVSLNQESTNMPYVLGRLFSVLEAIQTAANPGINATIKDKYFNSASATPGRVFPTLINLAQKHLRKLEGGLRIYHEKQLTELMAKLPEGFPVRMNLQMQGAFQLGYYQQTLKRYEKKEEKENG